MTFRACQNELTHEGPGNVNELEYCFRGLLDKNLKRKVREQLCRPMWISNWDEAWNNLTCFWFSKLDVILTSRGASHLLFIPYLWYIFQFCTSGAPLTNLQTHTLDQWRCCEVILVDLLSQSFATFLTVPIHWSWLKSSLGLTRAAFRHERVVPTYGADDITAKRPFSSIRKVVIRGLVDSIRPPEKSRY